jgi:hypothetical protein
MNEETGGFPAGPEAKAEGEASGAGALRRGGYRPPALPEQWAPAWLLLRKGGAVAATRRRRRHWQAQALARIVAVGGRRQPFLARLR